MNRLLAAGSSSSAPASVAGRRLLYTTVGLRQKPAHEKVQPDDANDKDFHPADYKPGSSSVAYDNPWPKLNKGRFDWLFGDGWRRPLAADQGAWKRFEWVPFGWDMHDEHKDWFHLHKWAWSLGIACVVAPFVITFSKPEWPDARNWARREAYFEIERRRQAGLPLISAELLPRDRVVAQLPSDEEIGDFKILI